MATVFTKIIRDELPGLFVWSDERCVVFLSINPIQTGHALVVPRAEVDHWLDLEPSLAAHLMEVSQAIGKGQSVAFSPERIGLIIVGFEVPHVHAHVIPTWSMRDLSFKNAAQDPDSAEMAAAAEKLRSALRSLGYAQAADKP